LPGLGKTVSGSNLADYLTPQQPKMTKALSGSSLSPIENLPPSAQLGKFQAPFSSAVFP
jgi:hypothetical protein